MRERIKARRDCNGRVCIKGTFLTFDSFARGTKDNLTETRCFLLDRSNQRARSRFLYETISRWNSRRQAFRMTTKEGFLPDQASRKATIGSIRLARRAGHQLAKSATVVSKALTAAMV